MAQESNPVQWISGVTEPACRAIFFFQEKKNIELLSRLKKWGIQIEDKKEDKKEDKERTYLAGKRFVFTGSLKHYTRQEARELVEKLGARAVDSVSQKTDYVIVGENPGSKYERAKKLGISTITEEEFEELMR